MLDTQLLNECIESVHTKLSGEGCFVVVPSDILQLHQTNHPPTPASDLRLGNSRSCHFIKKSLSEVIANQDPLCVNISTFLSKSKQKVLKRGGVLTHVKQCETEIYRRLNFLMSGRILNEANLQFVVAGPIMMLVCEFWNLEVSVPIS